MLVARFLLALCLAFSISLPLLIKPDHTTSIISQLENEDVEALQSIGINVHKVSLPYLYVSDDYLGIMHSFAVYLAKTNSIVIPSNFNIDLEANRDILRHEIGHALLTAIGMPLSQQEPLCYRLQGIDPINVPLGRSIDASS